MRLKWSMAGIITWTVRGVAGKVGDISAGRGAAENELLQPLSMALGCR